MPDQNRAPRYFTHTVQKSEGCDYTIGCGHSFREIEATSLADAATRIEGWLMDDQESKCDDFNLDPSGIETLTVYEVTDSLALDMDAITAAFVERLRSWKEEIRMEKEWLLYQRLKAKYEASAETTSTHWWTHR